jgi:hypothetical protein
MVRRLPLFAVWLAFLYCFHANPSFSLETAEGPDGVVWTAIIPDAFPRYVYTWRMRSDGTYREDGRDALKGTPIQETLSGRWTMEGARMILRQQGIPYVFDGVVLENVYTGTLYLNGRSNSRFCAAKVRQPRNVATKLRRSRRLQARASHDRSRAPRDFYGIQMSASEKIARPRGR